MSVTTAAHRHPHPDELDPTVAAPPDPTDPAPFVLRQQVAERLAAHRSRHPRSATSTAPPTPPSAHGRSAHIAAAVAERYAQSPTYRSFLAAEAERSVRLAEAEADVATINAQAIAVAQQQLLSDLQHWDPDPEDFARGPIPVPSPASLGYTPLDHSSAPSSLHTSAHSPAHPIPDAAPVFTVRPFVDPTQHSPADPRLASAEYRTDDRTEPHLDDLLDDPETLLLLEEEIAFRHDPTFDEPISDPLPLTANLLEFPRQLVAARRARPRIEEGPLREGAKDPGSQLRIFEVASDQLSTHPFLAVDDAPEWASILLAAHPHTDPGINPETDFSPSTAPFAAPIARRCQAAAVDAAVIFSTLAAFLGIAVLTVTRIAHLPIPLHLPLPLAAAALAALLVLFSVAYLVLFFTLADSTPGMRFARIALCTLSDENPTRSAMRRRLLYTVLAALPLGLGLLWAFLDEDRLGWHDRLSRMVQRSY